MSEEPLCCLPSLLGAAASPTALGGGHSARPESLSSLPGDSSGQPGQAPQSSADTRRTRGRLNSDSRRRRFSARRQPPRRAGDHTRAVIGCRAPGPDDVSASLIGEFHWLPTDGGGARSRPGSNWL